MLRRLTLLLFICMLWLPTGFASQVEPEQPVLRALLLGADLFQSQPDTQPAAGYNLRRLADALSADSRGYERFSLSLNQVHSLAGFERLVADSFEGAEPWDISLFYITTHGLLEPGAPAMDFAMLLSDGHSEHALTAWELHRVLSRVPGRKILIIDSCNAGALIDRGMPGDGLSSLFTTPEYRVITASGGSEPSFFWSTGQGSLRGGSYFADALSTGISRSGNYAADSNRDGLITLEELHGYLMGHYGLATPQVYPRDDHSLVFSYEKVKERARPGLVTNLELEERFFSPDNPELHFAYTLNQRARIAYQLIYHLGSEWQFTRSQWEADSELPGGEMLPGRKEKALRISLPDPQASGYVLLLLTSIHEDSARPLAQALLSVETAKPEPDLRLSIPQGFLPALGQELPIHVKHRFPLRLSLHIEDMAGAVVARLAAGQSSRPMHLPEGGSLLYWSGRLPSGELAPPGRYRASLKTQAAGQQQVLLSDWFELR